MSNVVERIAKTLGSKYQVDEFFYPKISMNLDLPDGFKGEISRIADLLDKNGFEGTVENVFQVMKFKRELILRYTGTSKGRESLEEYNNLLLKHVKPVGVAIPIEMMFVSALAALILYVGTRFLGSFADEAGKIVAKKLLSNDKELSKEHNMSLREYKFLKNQIVIFIEDGSNADFLIRNLQKKNE